MNHSYLSFPFFKGALLSLALFLLGSPLLTAQTAYIPNSGDGTMSVIDIATGAVTATVQIAPDSTSDLRAVWATDDGQEVWIGDQLGSQVFIYNTADNTPMDTIATGVAPVILVAPGGETAYITNFGDSTLFVVDGISHVITDTIIIGGEPGLMAITPDGNELYVPVGDLDEVVLVDLTTNSVVDTFPVGIEPELLQINPAGTEIYVSNFADTVVTVIDIATKMVTDTIESGLGQAGLAFTPDGSFCYVANFFGSTVSVINTSTKVVDATIDVGEEPSGLNVTADGTQVYVANQGSANVMVIDVATNTVVDSIVVGNEPVAGGQFISIFPEIVSIANETAPVGNLTLYPNPVSAELNVSLQLLRQESLSYRVHNTLGQVISQGTLRMGQESLSLDVSELEAGIYFLSIEGAVWSQTESFVKR